MNRQTEQIIKKELEKINSVGELVNLLTTHYDQGAKLDWQILFKIRYFGFEFLRGLPEKK